MNKNTVLIISFIIIFALICLFNTVVNASDDIDPSKYEVTYKYDDGEVVFKKAAPVIKIIRNIAAIVAVVSISIIGFRYMIGSVSDKAQYKETMIPVIIGGIMVGTLATILTVIQSIFN